MIAASLALCFVVCALSVGMLALMTHGGAFADAGIAEQDHRIDSPSVNADPGVLDFRTNTPAVTADPAILPFRVITPD